uniref:AP-2 complex subunit alpha, putative n=1 Tax=Arundo donax TaxID=35708 RepID=A0A0A9GGY3_ARUDO
MLPSSLSTRRRSCSLLWQLRMSLMNTDSPRIPESAIPGSAAAAPRETPDPRAAARDLAPGSEEQNPTEGAAEWIGAGLARVEDGVLIRSRRSSQVGGEVRLICLTVCPAGVCWIWPLFRWFLQGLLRL